MFTLKKFTTNGIEKCNINWTARCYPNEENLSARIHKQE